MSERRRNDVRYLTLLNNNLTFLSNVRYPTSFRRLSDATFTKFHPMSQMCTGLGGTNFQNSYWRLESLHQRTLIYILYEFLCNSFRGQGPNSLGHLLSPFGSQQSTEDEFPSESGQLFDPQNR